MLSESAEGGAAKQRKLDKLSTSGSSIPVKIQGYDIEEEWEDGFRQFSPLSTNEGK